MNKKLALTAIGFIMLYICGQSMAYARNDHDWQFWGTISAQKQLNEQVVIVMEEETRWTDDFNKFAYQAEDIGIIYEAAPWIDLGINFRYVVQKNLGGWEHEARPHLNLTLKRDFGLLDLSNRIRFEYRYLTRTKDSERFRNLTQILFPLEWTRLRISPFIRQEVFFNTDQDNYNQNRLSGGCEFRFFKRVTGELFYLWRADKSVGKWSHANVLGAKINFIF